MKEYLKRQIEKHEVDFHTCTQEKIIGNNNNNTVYFKLLKAYSLCSMYVFKIRFIQPYKFY